MIEFRVEWQDAPGVRDPVLARTWCRLTMDVDGQVVTRAIDHRSESLRDGIYGSALPLCSWMVENWWCLQHEAYRFHRPWRSHDLAVNVDHRAWVQRHSLRAVGEGGVLPDLMLFRDGDGVVVRWFADKADAAHPYLRFVGDGQASMPVDEVTHGLTDFVLRVLDRIEEMDALSVEYLVQAEDLGTDGITIAANALAPNGGSIQATDSSIDADLTHAVVAPDGNRKVDGGLASSTAW